MQFTFAINEETRKEVIGALLYYPEGREMLLNFAKDIKTHPQLLLKIVDSVNMSFAYEKPEIAPIANAISGNPNIPLEAFDECFRMAPQEFLFNPATGLALLENPKQIYKLVCGYPNTLKHLANAPDWLLGFAFDHFKTAQGLYKSSIRGKSKYECGNWLVQQVQKKLKCNDSKALVPAMRSPIRGVVAEIMGERIEYWEDSKTIAACFFVARIIKAVIEENAYKEDSILRNKQALYALLQFTSQLWADISSAEHYACAVRLIKNIDWRLSNPDWQGRILNGNDFIKRKLEHNFSLLQNYFYLKAGGENQNMLIIKHNYPDPKDHNQHYEAKYHHKLNSLERILPENIRISF